MKVVNHAWLFDVDGVITHPEKKQVTKPQILSEIVKRLQKGEPVALVTGRSLSWLQERVIRPFQDKIIDLSIYQRFFVVGEVGGAWATFKNGQMNIQVDRKLRVPEILANRVKQLVQDRFSEFMFFDNTKKTMISVEVKDGVPEKELKLRQPELDRELEKILKGTKLSGVFKLIPLRLSTDVMYRQTGKGVAAGKAFDLIKANGFEPQKFIIFGDYKTDIAMAQELHRQRIPVEFVFVGEEEQLAGQKFSFPVTFTKAHSEKGTLEYLTSHPFLT